LISLKADDARRRYAWCMTRRIVLIDGHPDPNPERFCHSLARAYSDAAGSAGHEVRYLALSGMDIPLLRSAGEWMDGTPAPAVRDAQDAIGWADHLVIVYPLWLGAMPALLKAFFEQAFRPGFAIPRGTQGLSDGLLKGKSARIVVTMGMPAWIYRWFFRAHSLKSFERNILKFVGIGPIRETLIGNVEGSAEKRAGWLETMRSLGTAGR
jgi:putative NADPH-quinone reductase